MASSSSVSGSPYEANNFADTCEISVPFDPGALPAMEDPVASATLLFEDPHGLGPKNENGHGSPATPNSTDAVSAIHYFA